jgi:hypothetical protein
VAAEVCPGSDATRGHARSAGWAAVEVSTTWRRGASGPTRTTLGDEVAWWCLLERGWQQMLVARARRRRHRGRESRGAGRRCTVECSAGWGGRGLSSSERRERGVTGRWQVGREGDRVGGSSPVGKIRKYSDFSFNLFHHGNEK